MRVKDVERLTGLSTKAIRLYEEKGLISVERNPVNDYRDYSYSVKIKNSGSPVSMYN
ncbi:MerR family transcriptional regulator [Streptococcus suis]|nr:MerR family transcriptional regulator [Streptococcus suis]